MNEEINKSNDMIKGLSSLFIGSALLGMSAIFVRYSGVRSQTEIKEATSIITQEDNDFASLVGSALRLSHVLCGGVSGLLTQTNLSLLDEKLILRLGDKKELFQRKNVEKIVANLGALLKVKHQII